MKMNFFWSQKRTKYNEKAIGNKVMAKESEVNKQSWNGKGRSSRKQGLDEKFPMLLNQRLSKLDA